MRLLAVEDRCLFDYWSNEPYEGSYCCLHSLREAGHRIDLLVKDADWATNAMWRWLAEAHPPFHSVTRAPAGRESAFTSAEILIGASEPTLEAWTHSGRLAIGLRAPCNKDMRAHAGGLAFVPDWKNVCDAITFWRRFDSWGSKLQLGGFDEADCVVPGWESLWAA